MSSGRFNSSEPVWTIVQHKKPGLWWILTWLRCGSTLPNLVEPLSARGNKDHKIIYHEFGVVQLFRTCSNHSSTREIVLWSLFPLELMRNYPMILVPSRAQWRKSWTTPTKPRRTSELQSEQVSYDNFSWVRGCSTLTNIFEPQFNTGNQACSWTWHEFRVVQLFRTCSNHWALEWTRITG